jgi:hypothetical protein
MDSADTSTTTARARRRYERGAGSAVIIGGTAVAALALVGGGAYVASQLTSGGEQPADVLPGDTLAYLRVDLDPSASQKVDLLRLLQRVPEFEQVTGISSDKEDLRRTMGESVLGRLDCEVDYDEDVEPWIGDRAAFAAVPGTDEPAAFALLQVTDASAAESGLAAIADCFGGDDAAGAFAFTGDYVVLAETQAIADSVVSGGEDSALSDNETHAEDMDRLGDAGVASFWADVPAVAEIAEQTGSDSLGTGLDEMQTGELTFAGVESAYGAVRAGSDSIELALFGSGDQFLTNAASPVAELPDSTLAALSVSGLGAEVPELWDRLRDASGMDAAAFDADVRQLEQSTGLRLPDDLATLLGDNLTVALDTEGLDSMSLQGQQSLPEVNAGVRFSGDAAAIVDVIDRMQTFLTQLGLLLELASEEVDGGVVVATNQEYAAAMTDQGLAGSDSFGDAVGDVDDVAGVLYLDLDSLAAIAGDYGGGGGDVSSFAEYLEPMEAIGVKATAHESYTEASVRLTFDE